MTVVITKRRKAFNVIYTIEKENGEAEKNMKHFMITNRQLLENTRLKPVPTTKSKYPKIWISENI